MGHLLGRALPIYEQGTILLLLLHLEWTSLALLHRGLLYDGDLLPGALVFREDWNLLQGQVLELRHILGLGTADVAVTGLVQHLLTGSFFYAFLLSLLPKFFRLLLPLSQLLFGQQLKSEVSLAVILRWPRDSCLAIGIHIDD